MKKTTQLRRLIERKEILVAPGIYDGISARLVQSLGFQAGIITGAGIANSRLGKPDVGIMGLAENLDQARNIADSVDIPLRADIDTGYGNAINVYFAVQMFEKAGVAGIMIEDQVWPKSLKKSKQRQPLGQIQILSL